MLLRFSGTFHLYAGHSAVSGAIYPTIPHWRPVWPHRDVGIRSKSAIDRTATSHAEGCAERSCRRSRAEAAERGPGQWRNTEQRPLERSACRALRSKPATNVRFWRT